MKNRYTAEEMRDMAEQILHTDDDWYEDAGHMLLQAADMIEREATREKSSQVGNEAAMREACANIAEYAKTAACHTEDTHLLGYLNQIERWTEAALSALPKTESEVKE